MTSMGVKTGSPGSVVPLGVLEGSVLGPGPSQHRGRAGGRHGDLEHLLALYQSQEGPQAVQGRLGAPLPGQQARLKLQAFLLKERGGQREASQNSTVQAPCGRLPGTATPQPLSHSPSRPLRRLDRNQAEGLTKPRQQGVMELNGSQVHCSLFPDGS